MSDEQGRYEVMPGVHEFEVHARLHSKGVDHLVLPSIVMANEEDKTLKIALPVGPTLSGTIQTWDSRLPREVLVEVADASNSLIEKRLCTVGSKGEFRVLLERASGTSSITGSAPEYPRSEPIKSSLSKERDLEGLTLRFVAAADLAGVVVDEHQAIVPDAKILLRSATSPSRSYSSSSNQSGQFRFGLLRPGEYSVLVEAAGFAREPQSDKITVAAGELRENIVLTLVVGWWIGGKVIDTTGKPIANCTIQVDEGDRTYGKATADFMPIL